VRLSAREDIDAPQERAFRALAAFDHWERAALRKGASVLRTDTLAEAAPGMTWQVGFVWRGRPRNLTIHLTEIDAPQALRFEGVSPSFQGWMAIEIVRMGARRSRLAMTMEIKPRTLASRLFLQSARLARGRITKRLDMAMKQLGAFIISRQPRD
jgi:Polyketide cyclase / dehydrase and lipid transport